MKLFLFLIGAVFILTACDDAKESKNDTDILVDEDSVSNDIDVEDLDTETEDTDTIKTDEDIVSDTDVEEKDDITTDEDIVSDTDIEETDEDIVSDTDVEETDDITTDEDIIFPDDDSETFDCQDYESDTAVIKNGSFTQWSEGYPDSWVGAKTNIYAISSSIDGKSCGGSVELINNTDKHLRFTTAAQTLQHGRYNCSYFVKGTGEIRNAYYDGDDFSGYSSYISAESEWKELTYSFNLADDVTEELFELVFSLRNTEETAGILLDNVKCIREAEYCDSVTCDEWEECSNSEEKCIPLEERCNENTDCETWEECNTEHYCLPAEGRCATTSNCPYPSETPNCDTETHTCVAGDPCENITCDEWKQCDPAIGECILSIDRCITTADCSETLPACDTENHSCVEATSDVNVIPNGSFESWNTYSIAYYGDDNFIPDNWYGLDFTGGDNTGDTEIDPSALIQTETAHSGNYALQINFPGMPADRFTSEGVDIPAGNYSCHYFVKGTGNIKHRWYSKLGWATDTDFQTINSESWIEVPFTMSLSGTATDLRFIFYVSNTVADDHIIIDDLVCTKN